MSTFDLFAVGFCVIIIIEGLIGIIQEDDYAEFGTIIIGLLGLYFLVWLHW